jgi:hypothetical protein
MSDIPSSPGVRGNTPDLDAPPDPGMRTDTARSDSTAGEQAKQVARHGKEAAGDVRDTAKEQARRVAGEATTQARNLAADVRDRVGEQARSQNDRLVDTIRRTADQLDDMRGDRDDSPATAVVSRVADSGRQFADYLDRHGPDGVLREVQDFARRRPGAFLAAALAAGFVVGRLGKGVARAEAEAGRGKPTTDSFVSQGDTATRYPRAGTEPAGYPTGQTSAEYAATGTGTPVMVTDVQGTEPSPPVDRTGGVR